MNIVLMAGGSGTRLWPVSRRNNPKQFFKLQGNITLLEQAYQRAARLVSPSNIFVATLEEYRSQVEKIVPEVPAGNRLYEPNRRDTAAAFAAVNLQLKLRGQGDKPAIFLWSDHVFTSEAGFVEDIRKIPELIARFPDSMVMVGHVPAFPETGFGYIEAGEAVAGFDDVFQVKSFKEKPKLPAAKKFLAAGNFFWNMGSFSFRPEYFLQELMRYEPQLRAILDNLEKAFIAGNGSKIAVAYEQFPKIAVEYAVMEKTPRIIVVTGDYGWSDVGNWAAVHDILGIKGDHTDDGHHVHVGSKNNFIYNTTKKAVSLVGMKDTIVVVTDDAVLVTRKKDAYLVKEVVKRLEEEGKSKYL